MLHGRPRRVPAVRAVRGTTVGRRAGWPGAGRPGTCARTRSVRPAGRAPMPPACRSCRVSSATTRSLPARSSTHCGSPPTARARRTSTRPATRPASRIASSLPPMGLRVRLKATYDTSRLLAAGPGHRRGAQALRDDPRRQRLAVVRHRVPAIPASTMTSCTSSTSSRAATSRSSTRPGWSTARSPPRPGIMSG